MAVLVDGLSHQFLPLGDPTEGLRGAEEEHLTLVENPKGLVTEGIGDQLDAQQAPKRTFEDDLVLRNWVAFCYFRLGYLPHLLTAND